MCRRDTTGGWRHEEAYLLIEVMMAIVLLATLVVPLATGIQRAIDRASSMREQACGISEVTELGGCSAAWVWGPAVESVAWQPGPVLHLKASAGAGAGRVVGLWADGWLVGEWEVDGSGETTVAACEWSGMTGSELVIRLRESEGLWGPPWRSIVPDPYCGIPGERAPSDLGSSPAEDSGEGRMVAHVPALGNPLLYASWTDQPIHESALGLTFFLPPATGGYCELGLDGRAQLWEMEEGRALDVYF